MKKVNMMITLLAVSILMVFCVHFVALQLVFVAAAAFFCYRLSEQFCESRREGREKDFLRSEELFNAWQDRLTGSLNDMAGQLAAREEQLDHLLKALSVQNTEQTERCVRMMEQLAKDGEELIGRMSGVGEKMALSLADRGEKMTQSLVSNGEKAMERMSKSGEELLGRLVSNGEELLGRVADNGEEMTRMLSEMGERLAAALEKEAGFCASVEEQVKTIRTINEINNKKLLALTQEHYDNMRDLFEDQNDEIEEALGSLKTGQTALLRENCENMEKQMISLREAVQAGIQPVLDQNKELLAYIQEVQKEWTELDKQELKFLDKVWKER